VALLRIIASCHPNVEFTAFLKRGALLLEAKALVKSDGAFTGVRGDPFALGGGHAQGCPHQN
jgi:hypothetical protein